MNEETYKDININLVKNGIYPIIYDINGNYLFDTNGINSEKIKYPKYAGTVINEGKLLGQICIYIRFSGCNLYCCWLDTEYKGNPCDVWKEIQYENRVTTSLYDILTIIQRNTGNIKNIVITGGEPTLQTTELNILLQELKELGLYTILETNCTIYNPSMLDYIDFLSMNLKLSNTLPSKSTLKSTGLEYNENAELLHNRFRCNPKILTVYTDYFIDVKKNHNFELKFTVTSTKDENEIKYDYLSFVRNINQDDIVIIPEGTNNESLKKSTRIAFDMCVKNDWRFSPRLLYSIFDDVKECW